MECELPDTATSMLDSALPTELTAEQRNHADRCVVRLMVRLLSLLLTW